MTYLANFVQNCEIYYKELLVNEINGIINSEGVVTGSKLRS